MNKDQSHFFTFQDAGVLTAGWKQQLQLPPKEKKPFSPTFISFSVSATADLGNFGLE